MGRPAETWAPGGTKISLFKSKDKESESEEAAAAYGISVPTDRKKAQEANDKATTTITKIAEADSLLCLLNFAFACPFVFTIG